ncbi:MAG: carboxypeptidase-like regulatory domain-containing protein [Candidatus Eremiobacteraeota bacterium]|nr:carboxypeptidase-like regulatory domain-containing protein [Candidatus Eremiobacteraeota bacterium]MBV9402252.1 carboxypeptidase-like regulatory domain-containing protein [Candidatus Eremiobacteraeota bacterium]MBV9972589.1 carboxypeptidase-like regulatory domain-containing protein [Candidatus Eremiobacteraeota bacterium]
MKVFALAFVLLLGAQGGGCSNPNDIGVQDYGNVTGRVLDAKTNQPISGALISVGSTVTATTDAQGGFTLTQVPAGTQTVTVSAAGYTTSTQTASVKKAQTTQLDYIKLTAVQ